MRTVDKKKRSFGVFIILIMLTWAGASLSQAEDPPSIRPRFALRPWQGAPHSLPSGTAVISSADIESPPVNVVVPQSEENGEAKQLTGEQTPQPFDAPPIIHLDKIQKNEIGIQPE